MGRRGQKKLVRGDEMQNVLHVAEKKIEAVKRIPKLKKGSAMRTGDLVHKKTMLACRSFPVYRNVESTKNPQTRHSLRYTLFLNNDFIQHAQSV